MKQSGLHQSTENGKDLGINIQPIAVLGDYPQRASEGEVWGGAQGGRARGTGYSIWTRRSLVCMIHRQLQPPRT